MKRCAVIAAAVVLVGVLGSCQFLSIINPAWGLEGTWSISDLTSRTFIADLTEGSGRMWCDYSQACRQRELTLTFYWTEDRAGYSATLIAVRERT